MAEKPASPSQWAPYFKATARRPPHATAARAISLMEAAPHPHEVRVLDLGAGTGRDSLHFLACGWKVLAVDAHPDALKTLHDKAVDQKTEAQLECLQSRFENFKPIPASFDLINASMAFPFCRPDRFQTAWERIKAALKPGGVFAGHFFGKRDDWGDRPEMTFLWPTELESMLMGLVVVEMTEHELDRETELGEMKHSHYFDVVAKRP
jgi:SAM-dependent methyltransferase